MAISTFLICFPLHFLYEWIPSDFFACFLPVNESIYEHMKLIFTSILLSNFIFMIFDSNQKILSNYLSSILAIPIFLMIYLPIYYRFGEHMIVTLILLFLVIYLIQYIKEFLNQKLKNHFISNVIAIVLIILTYILFAYFTYHPIHSDFFFDPLKEKYGINDYQI